MKKNNNNAMLVVIILTILCGLGGAVYFFAVKDDGKKTAKPEGQNNEVTSANIGTAQVADPEAVRKQEYKAAVEKFKKAFPEIVPPKYDEVEVLRQPPEKRGFYLPSELRALVAEADKKVTIRQIEVPTDPAEAKKLVRELKLDIPEEYVKVTDSDVPVEEPTSRPASLAKGATAVDFLQKQFIKFGKDGKYNDIPVIQSDSMPPDKIEVEGWLLGNLTQGDKPFRAAIVLTPTPFVVFDPAKEKLSVSVRGKSWDPIFVLFYCENAKRHYAVQFDPVTPGAWMQGKYALTDMIDAKGTRRVLQRGDKITKIIILQGKFVEKTELFACELKIVRE